RSASGPVADATARFSGPTTAAPLPLGTDGLAYGHLEPGAWNVLIASSAQGLQQRRVTVPPDARTLIPVDVIFSPPEGGEADLVLRVTDPDGHPVPNAAVAIDGTAQGATSAAGSLELQALDAGTRSIDVVAVPFARLDKKVALASGAQEVGVQLGWGP